MSNPTPSNEMFEAFQKMINPMAFPMQNLLMGAMKPEELEKKISELQTVHHWLSTNLSMLELTIKTLEYQKALLTPGAVGKAGPGFSDNPFFNPALWPWPYQQGGTGAPNPDKPAGASGAASAGTRKP